MQKLQETIKTQVVHAISSLSTIISQEVKLQSNQVRHFYLIQQFNLP